ncbi:MAG: hypothetical protein A2X94_05350 [Bdellovibrionales bacterium GWB1_55_8]|nr:MAG: hypothetical protein A2X94_05350 [Bdellovibrionales bacterium GWB1_55_8]
MKFAESQWLWTIAAIPLLYLAALWQEKKRQENFAKFANRGMWPAIAPEAHWRGRIVKIRLLLAAFAFALLALARPQWGTREETIRVSGLDIVIALDVSNSMSVEDVVPSRLQKAKHVVRSFVESLRGDRVGLIAFAGSSYVACPLTNDLDYLLESVSLLNPRSVAGQGTDLGLALETARKAMERGSEDPQAGELQDEATRVVILLSDGEDHEEQALEAATELMRKGVRLFVLGIGTEKGGPIPLRDENGNLQGYKKERSGEPIVSSFRPDSLMKIATAAGGKYWNVTSAESEVQEMLAELNILERRDYAERTQLIYQDRFQYPLALAILLLLLEITVPVRRITAKTLLWLMVAGCSQLIVSHQALADSAPIGAYLENQKGLQAFSEGKAEQAKRHFGAAQALDPDNAALRYNQGVIQLQEGDVENGVRALDGAATAAEKSKNLHLLGEARFNQGAALGKAGNLSGAVQAYLSAIDAARKSGDSKLEKDARKNLELLAREQEKQKQQQKQEEKKDEQEKQDKKEDQKNDQKEDQKKQDDKDKDKDKNGENEKKDQKDEAEDKNAEPQRFKETSKETRQRQFKSVKLSDEDAERVMAELKSRERELQKKLKKQNGNQQRNGKDW